LRKSVGHCYLLIFGNSIFSSIIPFQILFAFFFLMTCLIKNIIAAIIRNDRIKIFNLLRSIYARINKYSDISLNITDGLKSVTSISSLIKSDTKSACIA